MREHVFPQEDDEDPLDLILQFIPAVKRKPTQIKWDSRVFGLETSAVPVYITGQDIVDVFVGTNYLNISVLQLWSM